MSDNKPHISQSQLGLYARCPEAYRRRYIEGDKRPPGIAAHVGSGVHAGAEHNFRQKIVSHENLQTQEIVDAAVAGFDQRVTVEGWHDEPSRKASVVVGEARDTVVQLAELHAATQAKAYQPIAVEHATVIQLPGCTRDLVAITDLRDDKNRVIDFKTASRKPTDGDADKSLQLTIVAAAHQVDTGKPPSELRLDTLVKTKTPQRHVGVTYRDELDLDALAARLSTVVAAIDTGIFPPADPTSWYCAEKWCGYFRSCAYVNGSRRS